MQTSNKANPANWKIQQLPSLVRQNNLDYCVFQHSLYQKYSQLYYYYYYYKCTDLIRVMLLWKYCSQNDKHIRDSNVNIGNTESEVFHKALLHRNVVSSRWKVINKGTVIVDVGYCSMPMTWRLEIHTHLSSNFWHNNKFAVSSVVFTLFFNNFVYINLFKTDW